MLATNARHASVTLQIDMAAISHTLPTNPQFLKELRRNSKLETGKGIAAPLRNNIHPQPSALAGKSESFVWQKRKRCNSEGPLLLLDNDLGHQ